MSKLIAQVEAPQISQDVDGRRVLIVEDELLIARSLSQKLNRLNYQVVGIESSGPDALRAVEQQQPDLVLMDIQLKGDMTGIDVAEAMRSRQIPVVYLTAFGDDGTWSEAEKTHPYGYLTKPARLADLKSAIKVALARHQEEIRLKDLLAEERNLNQLRSAYYAMLAHDLRTPLSIILVSADLVRVCDERLTEARKNKHFERIQSAVRQMTLQLESVMIAEQISASGFTYSPDQVDVVALLRDQVDILRAMAIKGQSLNFCSDQGESYRLLDPSLIKHIVNNLVSNAIKYSPQGSHVDVALRCRATGLEIMVKDQGIGIPAAFLDKLFGLFERAGNVDGIEGSGIGLHSVKQAVDCHQGEIKVTSEEGKGTRFLVKLPAPSLDL